MKDVVYFDLETQKSFSAVGGGKHKDKMGISVAVTYSTKTQQYQIFDEENTGALVEQLIKADLVVGWNHIDFDYPVLHGYTVYNLVDNTNNLDMMADLEPIIGYRLKLDNAATACLGGSGKSADGLDALKWWNQYKSTGDNQFLMQIAEYCSYDVKVTKCVYEYGVENRFILYEDKSGNVVKAKVDWK